MIDAADGLIARFAALASTEPARVFARFDHATTTFGALHRRSDEVASALRARAIASGDRVAVMLRNSEAALAVLYGLAKAGVTWVPVNVQLRGDNLRYVLDHSEPCLVIADDDLTAVITDSGTAARCIVTVGEFLAASRADVAFSEAAPQADDLFAIMYTSGTTGPPKGVMVTHRMLLLAGEAVARVSLARDGDVFFMWEPLYHIGGAQLLMLPLLRRVILSMVGRFSASRFWSDVRMHGATHIHFLGGILQMLLKQPPGPLDRTHGARIAWGGGCPADVWRPFQERFGVEIRECYGMTEASSVTTYNDTGLVGSVGQPLPWFTVSVRDEPGEHVAPGARGEIVVRTTLPGALTNGYFRNPEASARALRGGALHTGDLGSLDAAGNLYFLGRTTESVRCKGENVSAWEVEHVAAAHPAVEECAMIGVAADIGEQDIKLFVRPRPNHVIEPGHLSRWLSERLAPFQNPRYISVVEAFERTPSLRIVKHRLSRDLADCFDRLRPPSHSEAEVS